MSNPISLLIQRKTKVPTKSQNVHLWRSDWKKIYQINYEESKILFSSIGNHGVFESDAQFCKWMKDKFGEGIYFVSAWRKGRKGFWSFMKVELFKDRFRRLPKNVTKEEIELKNELAEKKIWENRMKSSEGSDKEVIESEIETSDEVIKSIKDDMNEGDKKRGCYPYLKSCHPMYSVHAYEDYGTKKKDDEFIGRMV